MSWEFQVSASQLHAESTRCGQQHQGLNEYEEVHDAFCLVQT